MNYIRYLFNVIATEYTPQNFPPPGPYWFASYYGSDSFSIRAYLPENVDLLEYWPNAQDITVQEIGAIEYIDRFPKPDWFVEPQQEAYAVPNTKGSNVIELFNIWLQSDEGRRTAGALVHGDTSLEPKQALAILKMSFRAGCTGLLNLSKY